MDCWQKTGLQTHDQCLNINVILFGLSCNNDSVVGQTCTTDLRVKMRVNDSSAGHVYATGFFHLWFCVWDSLCRPPKTISGGLSFIKWSQSLAGRSSALCCFHRRVPRNPAGKALRSRCVCKLRWRPLWAYGSNRDPPMVYLGRVIQRRGIIDAVQREPLCISSRGRRGAQPGGPSDTAHVVSVTQHGQAKAIIRNDASTLGPRSRACHSYRVRFSTKQTKNSTRVMGSGPTGAHQPAVTSGIRSRARCQSAHGKKRNSAFEPKRSTKPRLLTQLTPAHTSPLPCHISVDVSWPAVCEKSIHGPFFLSVFSFCLTKKRTNTFSSGAFTANHPCQRENSNGRSVRGSKIN